MASMVSVTTRLAVAGVATVVATASVASATDPPHGSRHREDGDLVERILDGRSLDGFGNNLAEPTLGQAGTPYARVAPANYADGVGAPVSGPAARYVSNRIFNDVAQNVFSERGVSQWGFVWGQFLDHTVGLRLEDDQEAPIAFDANDPLEEFRNDVGSIPFTRSAAAEGTGRDSVREQVNTVSSYIDAFAVYGGTPERLDWLRVGPLDGDPTNNGAELLTEDGYLPTGASRAGADTPSMDLVGRLMADSDAAIVAGDVRANENIALTATHTLFVREHNRIVAALPRDLPEEVKFAIARRVVGAEQQWITYTEFLPAMGVELPPYGGYDPTVDPSITNEFATVGFRAHSQIHGELETEIPLDRIGPDELAALEADGVEVTVVGDAAEIAVPLNVAFGNPGLLRGIGLGNVLAGLGGEPQYANDEMIDNQLRSVLFQIPRPEIDNPEQCLDGTTLAGCFTGVMDLGAIDIARGRDHGMPTYNQMRVAFGLEPADSFTDVTDETTDAFPSDPELESDPAIDDPNILDFVTLTDGDGSTLEPGSDEAEEGVVAATRRTTVASRLKSIYGTVERLDAFTGMLGEPHVEGTEFGPLQLAMWTNQFTALRDGDRFFYANDGVLEDIKHVFGIDFRRTLAEVIADNTELDPGDLAANVFFAAIDDETVGSVPGDENETEAETCGQRHAWRRSRGLTAYVAGINSSGDCDQSSTRQEPARRCADPRPGART
ncbi:MAG TPA: peroxidase family protein [Acidimicrobiales bacterium]|nr:peroxidase family protein [Acidimicrobiales bacterium]